MPVRFTPLEQAPQPSQQAQPIQQGQPVQQGQPTQASSRIRFTPLEQAVQPPQNTQQRMPQQAQQPQQGYNDPVGSRILSAVGGLASGGADIAQAIGDTPTYVLEKLNLISPATAKKLYKINQENADVFRPSKESGDIISQATEQYPGTYQAAKLVTDTAGTIATMSPMTALGAGATAATGTRLAGLGTRAVGSGLVNASMVNPDEKDLAFGIGAVASPIFDGAGKLISNLGTKANVIKQVDDVLKTSSTAKVNKAYKVVKELTFDQADKQSIDTLSTKVLSMVDNLGDTIAPEQARTLRNIASHLDNAGSHDDVLKVLQNAKSGQTNRMFTGLNASSELYQSFNGLKNEIRDVINQAAIRNNIPKALANAEELSQQNKMLGKVFKQFKGDPSEFSFKTANKNLNLLINKYEGSEVMKPTLEVLKGLQKLTQTAAKQYKMNGLVVQATGSVLAGGATYKATGDPQASVLGSVAGGLGANMALHAFRNFAATPSGQSFLRTLAKPNVSDFDIRNILKAMFAEGSAGLLNKSEE